MTTEDGAAILGQRLCESSDPEDVMKVLSQLSDGDLYDLCSTITAAGYTVVHLLAQRQKVEPLKAVLARGVDVNTRDAQGATPIHAALQHHALLAAQVLVDHGADVAEVVSRRKGTALLHKLVMRDRPAAVQLLLDNGADVNCRDKQHRTPLHLAAIYGRCHIAALLLQREACDVNALDQTGHTPFMLAIVNNSTDLARQLAAAHRTDVTLRDLHGMSGLHLAVAFGQLDVVRAVLARNTANLNSKERAMGRTPLHLACALTAPNSAATDNDKDGHKRRAVTNRVSIHLTLADVVEENGVDVPAGCAQSDSKENQPKCGEKEQLLSVNSTDCESEKTVFNGPSTIAAFKPSETDLNANVRPNGSSPNSGRQTGVISSSAATDKVYYLKTGSTFKHRHSLQMAPSALSKNRTSANSGQQENSVSTRRPKTAPQRRKVASGIVAGGTDDERQSSKKITEAAGLSPSNVAALRCKIVALLLDQGADANLMTTFRKSPLHIAAALGAADVTALLLRHTTNPNMLSACNKTALHIATEHGHAAVVPLLLGAGANPALRDLAGMTALHTAARLGRADIVGALLKGGAELNGSDFRQMTPLHHACRNGHAEVADLLVRAGCRTDLPDDTGRLPLQYNSENGDLRGEAPEIEAELQLQPAKDRTLQSRRQRKKGSIILAASQQKLH